MRRNAPETDDHTRVQGRSWYALDTKRYDRRVAVVVVVVVVQRFSVSARRFVRQNFSTGVLVVLVLLVVLVVLVVR